MSWSPRGVSQLTIDYIKKNAQNKHSFFFMLNEYRVFGSAIKRARIFTCLTRKKHSTGVFVWPKQRDLVQRDRVRNETREHRSLRRGFSATRAKCVVVVVAVIYAQKK